MDLKKNAPVLYSPRFWGVVVVFLCLLFKEYAWAPVEALNFLIGVVGSAVGIGTIDRFAEKSGSKDTK